MIKISNKIIYIKCLFALIFFEINGMLNIFSTSQKKVVNNLFPLINNKVNFILDKANINLSKQQISDLQTFAQERTKYFFPNNLITKNAQEHVLFYNLLFYKYFKVTDLDFFHLTSGYYFFSTSNKHRIKTETSLELLIKESHLFQGLLIDSYHDGGTNLMLYVVNKKSIFLSLIKEINHSVYKIHLMPTQETILNTVFKLCKLFNENPKINNFFRLKDLIHDFKIKINNNNDEKKENVMPIIVIYVSNFFIPKNEKTQDLEYFIIKFKQFIKINYDSKEYFTQYINYKKSKECTQALLTYLVWFFNQPENDDCIGSDIVPRFNQKVTDLIFFAQGHGDHKSYSDVFEEQEEAKLKVYFKAEEGEDFKIDSAKVIEDAERLDSNNINIPMPLVEEISQNKGKNISNDNSGLQNIVQTETKDLKSSVDISHTEKTIEQTIASSHAQNITTQQNTTSTQSNQSSIVNTNQRPRETERSDRIWTSIANFFKSIFYTIFEWLNFG
ncbi:hypothetical protein EKK58_10930 [Candidatus Dependentiae bacterium]|nr:MAG: hypothetical protein EKK58_10930 [Candidatus Dependentiae bacterium]